MEISSQGIFIIVANVISCSFCGLLWAWPYCIRRFGSQVVEDRVRVFLLLICVPIGIWVNSLQELNI